MQSRDNERMRGTSAAGGEYTYAYKLPHLSSAERRAEDCRGAEASARED